MKTGIDKRPLSLPHEESLLNEGDAAREGQWECNCVLPGQSCPACRAAARQLYSDGYEPLQQDRHERDAALRVQ